MRIAVFLLTCVALSGAADEILFSRTFDDYSPAEERHAWRGHFKGVLVRGLRPDFLERCEARGFAEPREENGVRFLRFHTECEPARYIFSGFPLTGLKPGFYRLTVRGRTLDNPLSCELKTVRWIGEWYGTVRLTEPEWTERSNVFRVDRAVNEPVAVELAVGVGDTDVSYVALSHADEREYAAKFRRPPKGRKNLFRHRHFAFGLPGGWSAGGTRFRMEDTALVKSDSGSYTLYSEPFQTDDPHVPCTVCFRYRANGSVRVSICEYDGRVAHEQRLPAASVWTPATVVFSPNPYTDAFTVCFEGNGTLSLDEVQSFSGTQPPRTDGPFGELHIAPSGGEIGEANRIHFLDERPLARFRAIGAPSGACVRIFVGDLYGVEREITVDGFEGTFDWGVFAERPIGCFRLWGWIEVGGRRVSSVEELVMTRVPRPAAWGRDAPRSHFGAHFPPQVDLMHAMKAAGVNWTRFHDSCTHLSGWCAIEPEKGRWHWPDASIRSFRDHGVKIYAQLGTTPAWASHFGEMNLKTFGYFERYLRPTNAVDWVNYARTYAGRYKGQIDDYFIWNEPYYRWWSCAADAKFYDPQKDGADFARLCAQAYAAVKSVNPNAIVSGINTYPDGGRWAKRVLSGGAYEACDAMEFHYYTDLPRCRRGRDSNLVDSALGVVSKLHPECRKPIYMSEGGVNMSGTVSGLYRATVPWMPETKDAYVRNADNVVRFAVSLLSEGVDRIFLYTMHSFRALGIRNPYLKLLTPDGYPHPSFVAHAVMADKLDTMHFVERREYGEDAIAYVFADDVDRRCVVLAGLSQREVSKLLSGRKYRLSDIFGNPVTLETLLPETIIYVEKTNLPAAKSEVKRRDS